MKTGAGVGHPVSGVVVASVAEEQEQEEEQEEEEKEKEEEDSAKSYNLQQALGKKSTRCHDGQSGREISMKDSDTSKMKIEKRVGIVVEGRFKLELPEDETLIEILNEE